MACWFHGAFPWVANGPLPLLVPELTSLVFGVLSSIDCHTSKVSYHQYRRSSALLDWNMCVVSRVCWQHSRQQAKCHPMLIQIVILASQNLILNIAHWIPTWICNLLHITTIYTYITHIYIWILTTYTNYIYINNTCTWFLTYVCTHTQYVYTLPLTIITWITTMLTIYTWMINYGY